MENEERSMHLVELDTVIDLLFTIWASPAKFELRTKWFTFYLCSQTLEFDDQDFYDDMVARLMSPELAEVDTNFKLFVFSAAHDFTCGTE